MRRHQRSAAAAALVILASAVVGVTGASGSVAASSHGPKSVTCHSGDILTGFFKNVTVPSGNFCELLQATVEGNVKVAKGAIQIGIDNSTITGNVVVNGVTDNGWICGSRIGGNVTITKSASNPETQNSPGTFDVGFPDPNYCGSTAFDPVPGNAIAGDLTFTNNASGGAIGDNDIEDDLNCTGNTPPPLGTGNQVDDTNSGQCSALAGGTDDDTTSPGDND